MKEINFNNVTRQLFPEKINQQHSRQQPKQQQNLSQDGQRMSIRGLKESRRKENLNQSRVKQKESLLMIKQLRAIQLNHEIQMKRLNSQNERLRVQKQQLKVLFLNTQKDYKKKQQTSKHSLQKSLQNMQESVQQYRKYIIQLQEEKGQLQNTLAIELKEHRVKFRRLKQQFQQENAQLKSKNITREQQLEKIEEMFKEKRQEYEKELCQKEAQINSIMIEDQDLRQQCQILCQKIQDNQAQKFHLESAFNQEITKMLALIQQKDRQLQSFHKEISQICQQFKTQLKLLSQTPDLRALLKLFIKQLSPRSKVNQEEITKLKEQMYKIKKENVQYKNKVQILQEQNKFIYKNRAINQSFATIIQKHLTQEPIPHHRPINTQFTQNFKEKMQDQSPKANAHHNRSPILQIYQKQSQKLKVNYGLQQPTIRNTDDRLKIMRQAQEIRPNTSAIISIYNSLQKIQGQNDKTRKMNGLRIRQNVMMMTMQDHRQVVNEDHVSKAVNNYIKTELQERQRSLVDIMYSGYDGNRHNLRQREGIEHENKASRRKRANSLTTIVSEKCRSTIS